MRKSIFLFCFLIAFLLSFQPDNCKAQDSLDINLTAYMYNFWMTTESIAVSGDYAFLPDMSHGLQVIDISDPANPEPVAIGEVSYPMDITIVGNYAYVISWQEEFIVVDITDPLNCEQLGSCTINGRAEDLKVSGNYAYIAEEDSGLVIVDFSDPNSPEIAGRFITEEGARAVEVSGTFVYLAKQDQNGILVIDVSDPSAPVQVGITIPVTGVQDMVSSEDLLYCAEGGRLRIYDISTPSAINPLGTFEAPEEVIGISISGNHAFITCESEGLYIIDCSAPEAPVQTFHLDFNDPVFDLVVSGDYAYLSGNSIALHIVDVTNLTNPQEVGSCGENGMVYKIDNQEDLVFLGDQMGYIRIVDASDPYAPEEVGISPYLYKVFDVDVEGDYAYAACEEQGVTRLDVSTPSNPILESTFQTLDQAMGIKAVGEIVYILDHEHDGIRSLTIADFSTPTPSLLGNCLLPDGDELDVSGDFVYVAAVDEGLQIVDVSDPTQPFIAGSYSASGPVVMVKVNGDYAYLAVQEGSLVILDVSDPTNPQLVNSFATGGYIQCVTVSENLLYIGDWAIGLMIVDVTNPNNPVMVGNTFFGAGDIAVYQDHIYLAGYFVFFVMNVQDHVSVGEIPTDLIPTEFELLAPFPNPFNPSTSITVGLPVDGDLKIEIFNILGKSVGVLTDGFYLTGYHGFVFDASDLTSGTYFIRSSVGTKWSGVKRVVFMK
jgi:hypothetical protein